MEEINIILEDAEGGNGEISFTFVTELGKIRAGRANPSMLDAVKVDY